MMGIEVDLEPTASEVSNSTVLGDTALQSNALEDLTGAPNYQEWLASMALPFLGDSPIELGSGLGDYAEAWLAQGLPKIAVTEADPSRFATLESKFGDDPRVELATLDLSDTESSGSYSAFVSFNVLEHIPDDVAALKVARRMVRPGGNVISFVPAFPFAMSRFDKEIGHVRRYTLDAMQQKIDAAGLETVELKYVNAPGLFAWWLGMRVFRMRPGDGPILRVWDGKVIPRVRRYESKHKVPFGQSVFSVARVPNESQR